MDSNDEKTEVIDYLGKQNKGLFHNRIEENLAMEKFDWNNPEKTFAFMWQKIQEKGFLDGFFNNKSMDLRLNVTDRDRLVCASVIQWLGTNIGQSFLNEVLEKEGKVIVDIQK